MDGEVMTPPHRENVAYLSLIYIQIRKLVQKWTKTPSHEYLKLTKNQGLAGEHRRT